MIREDKINFVEVAMQETPMPIQIAKQCSKWLSVAVVLCCATYAQANNNYLVAPSGGNITGAALSAQLATGNVTLSSSDGTTPGSGNIIIDDDVNWTSNSTLTLKASDSVIIQQSISASGNSAGLVISPKTANGNEQPTTTGTFSLNQSSISLLGTGPTLTISGVTYWVINSLGAAADATTPPTPTTLQGMAAIANAANNYALGSDIDAGATSGWNSNAGFKPIGTDVTPFTGKFEGLGHKLSNLTIKLPDDQGIGLFGNASANAVIQNIALVNATVTGEYRVGALVGHNKGLINQSSANSTVKAKGLVGNLVGYNQGKILKSYVEGQVSADTYSAGSLVGKNIGLIQDCYATGAVVGSQYVGGLVGDNGYLNPATQKVTPGTIKKCYSTGSVKGSQQVGGLVGLNLSGSVIENSYWNTQTSGQSSVAAGATGLTTQQMMTQSSFTGFDFINTWIMVEGKTYPLFRYHATNIIYNVDQLQAIQNNLGGSYRLGGDIDASATAQWNSGAGFVPIGTSSAPFTGSLTGNGYTISNLVINLPSANDIGLFGYTSSTARINSVGMKDAKVTGQNNVGSLVGSNNATITNSFTKKVNITAKGSNNTGSGGLVGFNTGTGVITTCYSSGTMTGNDDVGGLVGLNAGQINTSNSWARVSNATGEAGGLVGTNQQNGSIVASYSSGLVGDVGTTGQIGGLVGLNNGSISYSNALGRVDCGKNSTCGGLVAQNGSATINATISNTYATVAVNGKGDNVGGLVGNNAKDSTVSSSYASGNVQDKTKVGELIGNVGGLIGNNEGSITNGYWNSSLIQIGVGNGIKAGATGLTAAKMLVSSSFSGFALTATPGASSWVVINTNGSLQSATSATPAATSPMLATEYATSISNPHQLQLMLMNPAANYSIIADVDALKTGNGSDVWGALGFVPVGNSAGAFTGSFDGKSKKISKLYINRTDNNVGLFGSTSNATISNVGLSDALVIGGNSVGALVGATSGGSISNSYINGYVSGAFTFTGGEGDNIGVLVGYNNGTITQSVSTGIAYGGNFVGGLAGYNSGSISNSSSEANANARKSLTGANSGGLVGFNTGSINNTYASGNVFSKKGYGGLVGTNNGGSISNSYARNSVHSPSSKNIGGLVGVNKQPCRWWENCSTGPINNSYWDTTTSGLTTSAGGTGLSDTQMQQQSSFSGWDFTNTWQMNTYPTLRNMPAP